MAWEKAPTGARFLCFVDTQFLSSDDNQFFSSDDTLFLSSDDPYSLATYWLKKNNISSL